MAGFSHAADRENTLVEKSYCCPLKLKRTTYYKRLQSAPPPRNYKTLTKSATPTTGAADFCPAISNLPNIQNSGHKTTRNQFATLFKVIKSDLKKFCADLKNFRADLTKKSRAKRCNVSGETLQRFARNLAAFRGEIFSLSPHKIFLSPCFQSLKSYLKFLKCARNVTRWK